MAAALPIDWNQAKILKAKGLSFSAIAKELGCSIGAVSARASREKWNESNCKAEQILQNHAVARAGERIGDLAEAWVDDMIRDVQESTAAARRIKPGSSLRQLGEREQVMERLVKRGRLMFGLNSEAKTTVQIAFFSNGPKLEPQAVDVQEVKTSTEPPCPD